MAMMKRVSKLALAAMALAALSTGQAQASTFSASNALAVVQSAVVSDASVVIDVAGIGSYDELGSSANTALTYNIGAFSTVNTISWNFTITANAPSWLADMQVTFAGSDLTGGGVTFTPSTTSGAGTESFADSVGLADLGLAFQVGADGILRVEFHESYVDDVNPDGVWNSGTLTVGFTQAVPEPSTYGLMALGLAVVGVAARRRRAK